MKKILITGANLCKKNGVKQFIFLSTMSVYGESETLKRKIINLHTRPKPTNYYGDSKLQAEKGLQMLEDKNFSVAVLRPPMVYGKGCKGNYQKLSKFIKRVPIFPCIKNQRSMIYIDNLCEFLRQIIEKEASGVFLPQNSTYVCTLEMAKAIAKANGKNLFVSRLFGVALQLCSHIPGKPKQLLCKVFGSMVYSQKNSSHNVIVNSCYQVKDFDTSIQETEAFIIK